MDDLATQNAQLNESIRRLAAEKVALDQSYGNTIRENHNLRTDLLLLQDTVLNKDREIASLNAQITDLNNKINNTPSTE